jgi:hypothetical protein
LETNVPGVASAPGIPADHAHVAPVFCRENAGTAATPRLAVQSAPNEHEDGPLVEETVQPCGGFSDKAKSHQKASCHDAPQTAKGKPFSFEGGFRKKKAFFCFGPFDSNPRFLSTLLPASHR